MAPRQRRKPFDVGDPADEYARNIARMAFVAALTLDARVRLAQIRWLMTPAAQKCLTAMRQARAFGDNQAAERAWQQEQPLLSGMLMMAIHPWSFAWLGELLGIVTLRFGWGIMFGDVDAAPPFKTQLTRPLAEKSKKLPRGGHEVIIRDVNWFYRTQVKTEPKPDTIGEIAREYAAAAHRHNPIDAKSVVREGIKRARLYLEIS